MTTECVNPLSMSVTFVKLSVNNHTNETSFNDNLHDCVKPLSMTITHMKTLSKTITVLKHFQWQLLCKNTFNDNDMIV